eukprot:CAMPEP_0175126028 /NCGR_PEP_ID=MMETSP0087-20121206/3628_1 /TAXON_ID=136419 /ORGANISM="Unknown Unknown, Strain D1" /LENGTH=111 /DNA_ID=CAMNT_0016407899 /DNA_START=348 /DNA_END=683 /DNA_ORIENTATION=-
MGVNLCFYDVVLSLCDVMSLLFSKFLDPTCSGMVMHDAIFKIDKKIKQLVLEKLVADLTAAAKPLIKAGLSGLLNHNSGSLGTQDTSGSTNVTARAKAQTNMPTDTENNKG